MDETTNTSGVRMIKTADVLKGLDTTALTKLSTLLNMNEFEGMTPLELYTWLHRLEEWSSMLKVNIRTAANLDYSALKALKPGEKTLDVTDFAKVTAASRPTSYTYTPELLDQMSRTAAAVAKAKEDGTAKKTIGELDATSQVLFKIALKVV